MMSPPDSVRSDYLNRRGLPFGFAPEWIALQGFAAGEVILADLMRCFRVYGACNDDTGTLDGKGAIDG